MHICLQVGSYYLSKGGADGDCPYASCSNADIGQKYTPGFAVTNDTCPTEACANKPAPAGFYFASAGSCDVTECSTGERGTYYTEGCAVGNCTNGDARLVASNPDTQTISKTATPYDLPYCSPSHPLLP